MIATMASKAIPPRKPLEPSRPAALADLDEGDVPDEIDAGRFRAGQIESILRHIPIVTVANLASAGVLLWLAWDTSLRSTILAWALAIAILTLWVYGYWAITRRSRPQEHRN